MQLVSPFNYPSPPPPIAPPFPHELCLASSTASRDAEASVTLLDVDRSGSLDAVATWAGTAETVPGDTQEGIVEVHAFLDMNASELTLDTQQAQTGTRTLCA